MQAFTAKGLHEKWVITYNGYMLDKIITKTTEQAVIRKHTTTIYMQGGKALPAFQVEKKKALAKGLLISNFDSTVKKPKICEKKAVVHPKMVKILGYDVPLDEVQFTEP